MIGRGRMGRLVRGGATVALCTSAAFGATDDLVPDTPPTFGETVTSVTLRTEDGTRRWYGGDLESFAEGVAVPEGASVLEVDGRAMPATGLLADVAVSRAATVSVGGMEIRTRGPDRGVVGVEPTDRGGLATLEIVVDPLLPWIEDDIVRLTLFAADAGPLRPAPEPPAPPVVADDVCSVSTLGLPVDVVAGASVIVRFCRPVRIERLALTGTVGEFSAPEGNETYSWKEAFVVPHAPGPDGSWIEGDATAIRTRPVPRAPGTWTTDAEFVPEAPLEGTLFLVNLEEQCWTARDTEDPGRLCTYGDVPSDVVLRIDTTPLSPPSVASEADLED